MTAKSSPFLTAAMGVVHAERPALPAEQPYFTRVERVPAGNYVEIWFRTGGCTWDGAAGCTMCNYGAGDAVGAADVRQAVAAALAELADEPHELMISPSGGLWDPKEVPPEALPDVYALARSAAPGRFFVETRAETVTPRRIAQLREALPGIALAVEVGLESSHDAVLAHCVNKGSSTGTFVRAAARLRAAGVAVYANVCLGTAFLDRAVAVRDTLASVRWALASGATNVVVFPLHVKPFTLLDVLHRGGAYRAVSLWDLVEVLHALGPRDCARTEIAWYRSYYDTDAKVSTSPVGCPACTPWLLAGLDRYRATQDWGVVDELEASRCGCAPPRALAAALPADDGAVVASLLEHYALVARMLELEPTWRRMRPRAESVLLGAFDGYVESRAGERAHAA